MALLRVLTFDHEGRPIQFDTWLDDLQLYLLSDSKDSVSLFDLASSTATAPPTTPDTECTHFGQHKTAQALYDAVVTRYSSPATAALGRLLPPYLFPELSAFATKEGLVSHLRASDASYRATVHAKFLDRNPPPMFITLYFIVTRLPDSLRSVRDNFLSLDPTSLTVDLLEEHLLAAETSAVAVGATGGAGGIGAVGSGGAGATGAGAAGPGGARTRGAGAGGDARARGAIGAAGTGGAGAAGAGGTRGAAGTGGARAGGTRGTGAASGMGTVQRRPFFYPHPQSSLPPPDSALRQVHSLSSSIGLTPPLLCPPTDQSQPQLLPSSPLPAPTPHTEVIESLTESREPETRASTPVRALRRVALPSPQASSLPVILDTESNLARAASPTVTRLLVTVVTDPDFEYTAAFALVTELVDIAARSRLDYALQHFSFQFSSPQPTPLSTGHSLSAQPSDESIEPSGPYPELVGCLMYLMTCTRHDLAYPLSLLARYVAPGSPQAPTGLTTLWVLLHVATQRDYELHSLDFSTAFCRAACTRRFGCAAHLASLGQHLRLLGFAPSTADPSLFLHIDTSRPPFYVLVYVNDLVFANADTEALTLVKSELSFSASASSSPRHSPLLSLPATRSQLHLRTSPTSGMGLVLGGRGRFVLTGHADACWVDDSATQRSSQGYTFSLGSGSVSWRSTCSSSVLSSSCEAEIYARAMAAQELR
ncbi:unnamed protein product [Closterium sp. NIES-53]